MNHNEIWTANKNDTEILLRNMLVMVSQRMLGAGEHGRKGV
jgi:hypothetical protein